MNVTPRRFQLRLVVLDVPVPLLRGQAVTLHAHVAREEGHLSALVALLDPRTGEEVKVGRGASKGCRVGRGGAGRGGE